MSGMRWTEEQLNAHLARTGSKPVEVVKPPRARVPRALAKASPTSKLEAELLGHLTVMQLAPVAQFRFHVERKWRLDFAFPDVLVGVEVDGAIFNAENGQESGRHSRGAGQCKDMEKKNAAAELGWIILTYGPPHVRSGEAALQIERVVTARRAGGLVLVRERDGTV